MEELVGLVAKATDKQFVISALDGISRTFFYRDRRMQRAIKDAMRMKFKVRIIYDGREVEAVELIPPRRPAIVL